MEKEGKGEKANLIATIWRKMEPTEFFKNTLAQLTFNNARMINELTGIAQYYKNIFAPIV